MTSEPSTYDKRELILCVQHDRWGNVPKSGEEFHIGRRIFNGEPTIRISDTFACGEKVNKEQPFYYFATHTFMIQNASVCTECLAIALSIITGKGGEGVSR